jgi:diguanylate cyclase (GGDEF)-like protein
VILGSVFPWLAYLLYILRLGPLQIDLVPFGLALASPIFAWALFRLKILEFVPIAKDGIIDGMRDGVIVIDLAGRVTDLNPAGARIFPHLSQASVGQKLASLVPEHPEMVKLLDTGTPPEVEIRVPSSEAAHVYRVYLSPVVSRRRPVGTAVLLSDITTQNLLRERLQVQATVDDLTGAANRRHFLETGRQELLRAKRYGRALSVVIFDLDAFKKINDTFGHEAGDQVLAATCETVRKMLRASDLLGRHGGEEFILLFPETPPAQAAAVAERLRLALIQTHVKLSSGSTLGFTASFGVAGTESVGNELLDDFIRAADRAMYEAKAAGRNCVRSKNPGDQPS